MTTIVRDSYDWWIFAAQWFTAVGTVGAVVVAVILARNQNRPRVRIIANTSHLIEPGHTVGQSPLYVRISATNTGQRDVVLTNLGWRFRRVRKRNFVQLPGVPPYSRTVPTRLAPGESAEFLLLLSDWLSQNGKLLAEAYATSHVPIIGPRIRVMAYASTGEDFSAEPDQTLLEYIRPATVTTPSKIGP